MAKGTRKTATRRTGSTTTGRGRGGRGGGGGGGLVSYNVPKMEARGLIQNWNKQNKLITSVLDGHQQIQSMLEPIAKLHGLELDVSSTSNRRSTTKRATRRTTTARTGRGRSTQQEQQTATA